MAKKKYAYKKFIFPLISIILITINVFLMVNNIEPFRSVSELQLAYLDSEFIVAEIIVHVLLFAVELIPFAIAKYIYEQFSTQ